jgi:TetR/AcrR family transcriptional regulator, mexJK operon transcriptional repressor
MDAVILADCPAAPTRREARRQSRREAILDVAERSFMENGYAGTTMSAIAAALGGSKGTLWNHFPSKDVLFGAVLDRATEDFRRELSLVLQRRSKVEVALRDFCRQFLTKLASAEAVALFRLVVGESQRFPELGRIFFERGPGRTREMLAGYLAEAMSSDRLRRDDPLEAATNFTGLCLSGCHLQLQMGVIAEASQRMIEDEVRRVVSMFLRAYAP